MAGNFPDVPAPRLAYDRDGTTLFHVGYTGSVTQFTQADMVNINNESIDNLLIGAYNYLAFIFPRPIDLAGYMIDSVGQSGNQNNVGLLETSTDTTTGFDGIWTSHGNFLRTQMGLPASARTGITALAVNNIKSVRFRAGNAGGFRFNIVHLYGAVNSYVNTDTLRIWHPTLDEPLDDNTSGDGAYLDWGDVVRGTTADRTFRIKNNSGTLTANTINISTEVLTNTTPTTDAQITYSDGGSFATSINIGNLAPGDISTLITIRKSTLSNAVLSVWWLRTVVEAGSWS